jgi:hypothetical protein
VSDEQMKPEMEGDTMEDGGGHEHGRLAALTIGLQQALCMFVGSRDRLRRNGGRFLVGAYADARPAAAKRTNGLSGPPGQSSGAANSTRTTTSEDALATKHQELS